MKVLTIFFILNATILILHEIESSYEREWEILKLPGKITGFLLLHVPLIMLLLFGAVEIERQSQIGLFIGIISGAGGMLPFLVHKIFVKRKDKFNLLLSNVLIYLNIIAGLLTLFSSMSFFIK